MNNNKIVPGVVLIALGVIFLLRTYGYVHFHWYNLWYLWPIIIVIIGINLIFANNRSLWATAIKLVVILGGIGLMLFGNFDSKHRFWSRDFYIHGSHDDDDDDDDDDDTRRRIVRIGGSSNFTEAFHPEAKIGELNISGGAAEYSLQDTTGQLFEANTEEHKGSAGFNYTHSVKDSVYTLNFGMQKTRLQWKGRSNNKVDFKLNTAPVWDVDLQVGAAKLDFDLSPYKVRTLDLNGGAADFEIKLGQPLARTNISVNTGVSEVKISIPKGAACHIETDSGLSSNKFEGFNKQGDNTYETPGFANARNKFYIDISGGISDFKVDRY